MMLGVVFFTQSIFTDRNNFQQIFLDPVEALDFLSSIVKRYFTSDIFLYSSGGLKLPNCYVVWIGEILSEEGLSE